ncbi:MAG: sensor domain-containing diguanylate cyclase [Alkalispirochaeta sp.]
MATENTPHTPDALVHRLEQLHEFHFELASAGSIDELCRTLVDRGRHYVGVDRMGLWFLDEQDPGWFRGSFGIDESGNLRDERAQRIPFNPDIYDEGFFQRRVQYRRLIASANYNARQEVVGTGDLVVAPLWNGTVSVGALSADNLLSSRPITDEDCQLIALIARMAGHLVTIKRTQEQLQRLAAEDGLTGLFNRTTGLRLLEQQIAVALRSGRSLAVAFIDLDGLKRVNDTSGHAMGDRFIQEVARLLGEVKRASDEVCRMGGDEFMMILPDTASEEAHRMMHRLTEAAGFSTVLQAMGPGPWVSYGIADLSELSEPTDLSRRSSPVPETFVQHLIHLADTRMYEEKRRHYDAHHYRSRHDFRGGAGDR